MEKSSNKALKIRDFNKTLNNSNTQKVFETTSNTINSKSSTITTNNNGVLNKNRASLIFSSQMKKSLPALKFKSNNLSQKLIFNEHNNPNSVIENLKKTNNTTDEKRAILNCIKKSQNETIFQQMQPNTNIIKDFFVNVNSIQKTTDSNKKEKKYYEPKDKKNLSTANNRGPNHNRHFSQKNYENPYFQEEAFSNTLLGSFDGNNHTLENYNKNDNEIGSLIKSKSEFISSDALKQKSNRNQPKNNTGVTANPENSTKKILEKATNKIAHFKNKSMEKLKLQNSFTKQNENDAGSRSSTYQLVTDENANIFREKLGMVKTNCNFNEDNEYTCQPSNNNNNADSLRKIVVNKINIEDYSSYNVNYDWNIVNESILTNKTTKQPNNK